MLTDSAAATLGGAIFWRHLVKGFSFDIEVVNGGSEYYPAIISTLRSNFASDPDNTYYITYGPQCPIPEPNIGVVIGNV